MNNTLIEQLFKYPWCKCCGISVPNIDFLCPKGCHTYPYLLDVSPYYDILTEPVWLPEHLDEKTKFDTSETELASELATTELPTTELTTDDNVSVFISSPRDPRDRRHYRNVQAPKSTQILSQSSPNINDHIGFSLDVWINVNDPILTDMDVEHSIKMICKNNHRGNYLNCKCIPKCKLILNDNNTVVVQAYDIVCYKNKKLLSNNPCCECEYGIMDVEAHSCYKANIKRIIYLNTIHKETVAELLDIIDKIGESTYKSICEYRKKVYLSGILIDRYDIVKIEECPYTKKKLIYGSHFTKNILNKDLDAKCKNLRSDKFFLEIFIAHMKNKKYGDNYKTKYAVFNTSYSLRGKTSSPLKLNIMKHIPKIINREIEEETLSLFSDQYSKLSEEYTELCEKIENMKNTGVLGIDYEYTYVNNERNTCHGYTYYGNYDDKLDEKFTDEDRYVPTKYTCGKSFTYRDSDQTYLVSRNHKSLNSTTYPKITLQNFLDNVIVFDRVDEKISLREQLYPPKHDGYKTFFPESPKMPWP